MRPAPRHAARRLAEIAERLTQLADELAAMEAMAEQTRAATVAAPMTNGAGARRRGFADRPSRGGRRRSRGAARPRKTGRGRPPAQEAEQALKTVRERLAVDAADLRLPEPLAELPAVETALDHYRDLLARLIQAVQELRLALPELQRQRLREQEARDDLTKGGERFAAARIEAEEAAARLEVLRDAVGAKVEELQRKLADARLAVEAGDDGLKRAATALRQAGEARAVAAQQAKSADDVLRQRRDARAKRSGDCSNSRAPGCCRPRCRMPSCRIWPAPGRSIPRSRWRAASNRRCRSSRTTTTRGRACNGRSTRS